MERRVAPLVGIGVPTYNRPEGLRRALTRLSAQTHPRLDILVSDNCSPGDDTGRVVAEMAERDPRIRYVRQPRSLGVAGNFRFVQRESGGEYFMWAADDDEWKPLFVERCLAAMESGSISAMSGFETLYRASGRVLPATLPALDPARGAAWNLSSFLRCLTPSLFYGLHRRGAVEFCQEEDFFDYYDCYFVMRLLAGGGIALVQDTLYVAGVDAEQYIVKPMGRSWGSGLRYLPFYRAARKLFHTAGLGGGERLGLEMQLAAVAARLFVANEGRAIFRNIKA